LNICAGTTSQIRQVLAKPEILQTLNQMLWQDDIDVKKEICYVFKNMGNSGDKKAIL
jgi:hypothetical protein